MMNETLHDLAEKITVWQAILIWLVGSFFTGFFGEMFRTLWGGR